MKKINLFVGAAALVSGLMLASCAQPEAPKVDQNVNNSYPSKITLETVQMPTPDPLALKNVDAMFAKVESFGSVALMSNKHATYDADGTGATGQGKDAEKITTELMGRYKMLKAGEKPTDPAIVVDYPASVDYGKFDTAKHQIEVTKGSFGKEVTTRYDYSVVSKDSDNYAVYIATLAPENKVVEVLTVAKTGALSGKNLTIASTVGVATKIAHFDIPTAAKFAEYSNNMRDANTYYSTVTSAKEAYAFDLNTKRQTIANLVAALTSTDKAKKTATYTAGTGKDSVGFEFGNASDDLVIHTKAFPTDSGAGEDNANLVDFDYKLGKFATYTAEVGPQAVTSETGKTGVETAQDCEYQAVMTACDFTKDYSTDAKKAVAMREQYNIGNANTNTMYWDVAADNSTVSIKLSQYWNVQNREAKATNTMVKANTYKFAEGAEFKFSTDTAKQFAKADWNADKYYTATVNDTAYTRDFEAADLNKIAGSFVDKTWTIAATNAKETFAPITMTITKSNVSDFPWSTSSYKLTISGGELATDSEVTASITATTTLGSAALKVLTLTNNADVIKQSPVALKNLASITVKTVSPDGKTITGTATGTTSGTEGKALEVTLTRN